MYRFQNDKQDDDSPGVQYYHPFI